MVEVTTSGGGRRRCVWKEEREEEGAVEVFKDIDELEVLYSGS